MGLTILVVLSDDFEGEGTAFYRDLDRSHDDLDIEHQMNEDHSFLPESIALPQGKLHMYLHSDCHCLNKISFHSWVGNDMGRKFTAFCTTSDEGNSCGVCRLF